MKDRSRARPRPERSYKSEPREDERLPLSDIKVLDLSRVLAGPWCTQILGDFGADVAKIEAPDGGDDTRGWGPPNLPARQDGETGESAYYLSCNRNKRSVTINLANPQGAALVRRLAACCDVVIENFKVGGLRKYGLDHASLSAANPRLVYCSITGFGQTGPYAGLPGYDFVAQAMGGLMSVTGENAGPPMKTGIALADMATGMYAATSILVALRHAERTGNGQHIDCSLLDTQLAFLANQSLNYLVSGEAPVRLGNAHPTVVPYRVFEAHDGPVVVAVGNNGQFAALCELLEAPELSADPRYRTNSDRVRNRNALESALQMLIGTWKARDLMAGLAKHGVPGGPVNDIAEAFEDGFCDARGVVHHFERDDGVRIPSVAYPAKLSRTPATYRRPPPVLGADTVDVLQEWLSATSSEIAALRDCGAIG
jgi:crotonobetainyl-CoA:carnitine CoA-transferase CaiB-like acyl-CoA transferase